MGPLLTYGGAVAVRVGAGFKTSDKDMDAKDVVLVVMNCEQSVVGIVADGRRRRGGLVLEDN
jgi:hypothetical protein